MGTMSVDFIVMGDCRRSYRKSPNHVFRADRNGCSSKKRLDPRRTRAARGSMEGMQEESKEFALATRPRFVAALINRMLTIRAKTPPL